jgi:truncated hemoglobin YjbI
MTQNDWIKQVVELFYEKAREDILIGYHFRHIKNFDEHIPRIVSFWEIQLLGKSQKPLGNNFDILNVHVPLGIKRGELGRWLVLLKKTIHEELEFSPDMRNLSQLWNEKLDLFEKKFSGFFGF